MKIHLYDEILSFGMLQNFASAVEKLKEQTLELCIKSTAAM